MKSSIYKSILGRELIEGKYTDVLNQWPVENDQYKVKTSFGETFVIESGSRNNPPLLLIHGSASNSFCWKGDVVSFSESYNVYAIDIIGEAGFSDEARPEYDTGAYATWIHDVLSALNLERTSIVGLSLGGWMALDFAVTYPDKVESMVLMCIGGLYKQKMSFIWKAIGYSMLGKWGGDQLVKLVNGGKAPNKEEAGMREALEFTSLITSNFKPRMDMLPVFNSDKLSRLTMPIMVMYGDKDPILNAEPSLERIKKHAKKVDAVLLKDTGHVIAGQTDRIVRFFNDQAYYK